MNETAKSRILLVLSLVLGLVLAACSGGGAEPPLKGAAIGGPFTLVDQNGRTVSDRDFAGRYRLVYFGYTHCPDICPTDLATIGQALRRFEQKAPQRAAKVQPIFITVDPERDTPAVVKEYVSSFHPRLIGLTGSPQQVAEAAKRFAVFSSKGPLQPGGGYAVNHSRMALLMDPKGQPMVLLPQEGGAEAMAAELDKWVK